MSEENIDTLSVNAEQAQDVQGAWPWTITLRHAVPAHGGSVTELTLREPRGDLLRRVGTPYSYGAGNFNLIPNSALFARHISELAGVPLSTVDHLHVADFLDIQTVLLVFMTTGAAPPN